MEVIPLILKELFMAGIAITHVNLQQGPFFLRDFAGVVKSTKSNELVVELRIHRGNRDRELFRSNSLTHVFFLGKTFERSRSIPR